jgi:hypothetical protein
MDKENYNDMDEDSFFKSIFKKDLTVNELIVKIKEIKGFFPKVRLLLGIY